MILLCNSACSVSQSFCAAVPVFASVSVSSSSSDGALSVQVLYEPQCSHLRPTMWYVTLHFCQQQQTRICYQL